MDRKVSFFRSHGHFKHPSESEVAKVYGLISSDFDRVINNVDVILMSDEEILKMNQKYLDHDFYTDILTFDLGDRNEIDAEIYISKDRVEENAQDRNLSFADELWRVLIHGMLHLVGFGDKSEEERAEMRKLEDKYLGFVSRETTKKNEV